MVKHWILKEIKIDTLFVYKVHENNGGELVWYTHIYNFKAFLTNFLQKNRTNVHRWHAVVVKKQNI